MKPVPAVFLVLLAACAPKPPELPPRLPAPQTPAVKPAPSANPAPVPTPTPRAFDESLLTGKEFLLEVPPVAASALDTELGPLESDDLADAAAALFDAAQKGGEKPLDDKKIDPRWSAYLQGWARRLYKEGISGSARAGVPLPEKDGGVMVPVRVVGEKREWQGWVYLVKSEAGWLVSDVQLQARDRDAEPFDPESPRLNR